MIFTAQLIAGLFLVNNEAFLGVFRFIDNFYNKGIYSKCNLYKLNYGDKLKIENVKIFVLVHKYGYFDNT